VAEQSLDFSYHNQFQLSQAYYQLQIHQIITIS